ncbi:MAG: pilus assembly protein TadB [Alphaproteobacteria bacterium]|nr:pilus assembly protein TadB [Alphaproteobacteria bacterium]
MSSEPIIYGMIFVAVLLLVEGMYLVVFGKSIRMNSRVNRRIDLLEKGNDREEVLETLRKERAQHRGGTRIPLFSIISKKAAKANIAFSPKALILVMVLLSVAAFVGLTLGTETSLPVRAAMGPVMGFGAVWMWLNKKAKARMTLLEEQLPEAVELMVRSLRVGHPFSSTINIVAQEVPDPLGSEFGIIADEFAYGMDITESLNKMAENIDMPDMRFLAVAVSIQQKSGGNLAEILEGLAKVIRARFKLFRRVSAITAEAKWSGMFLSAFPILALIGINVAQPTYYDAVMETEYFIPAVMVVVAFLVANYVFMKIMVNIKV